VCLFNNCKATFCQRLKTFLFQQSFPGIIIWHYSVTVAFVITIAILATLKTPID